jgi:serine/threonine protein phosphatase PrpC
LCELNRDIVAHLSGPDNGINDISLYSYKRAQQQQQAPPPQSLQQTQQTMPNPQQLDLNPIKIQETLVTKSKTDTPQPVTTERNLVTECCDSFIKSGITKWNLKHHKSYGIACSLYESNPITNMTVGDPIADTYAILTRRNNSIMLLADGVNWGPRSRLAARCAVRAAMNHINRNIFYPNPEYPNGHTNTSANNLNTTKYFKTHDLFKIMMRSFDAAQEFILQKKGTMTTLCCSIVCKLKDSTSSLWVVCTLSIGDSTAYVFNKDKGIFELTYGSRNLNNDRDMRNVGGALGSVYGNKPDVSNLNYSLMYIKEKDIVFLVSDGVSDNLDPCVSQTARRKVTVAEINYSNDNLKDDDGSRIYRHKGSMTTLTGYSNTITRTEQQQEIVNTIQKQSNDDQLINLSSLPQVNAYERYIVSLAHMNEIILRNKTLNETISAQETCAILIDHVLKLTALKRETLEAGLLEASKLNEDDKIKFQANLREKVLKLRGKLDHASIVAYECGAFM